MNMTKLKNTLEFLLKFIIVVIVIIIVLPTKLNFIGLFTIKEEMQDIINKTNKIIDFTIEQLVEFIDYIIFKINIMYIYFIYKCKYMIIELNILIKLNNKL